jgi:hypothetical protein
MLLSTRHHSHQWPLDRELARLSRSHTDVLTSGDLLEGVLGTGSTGSGKTSGFGLLLQMAILNDRWGCLWLCVKADELNLVWERARASGRERDVVVIGPNYEKINILDVFYRTGGVLNVAFAIFEIAELLERKHSGGGGSGDFFQQAAKQDLRNILVVAEHQPGGFTVDTIYALILACPHEVLEPAEFAETGIGKAIARARSVAGDTSDLRLAENFFRIEWASLADKTRSSIQITLSTVLDLFCREPLKSTFFSTATVDLKSLRDGNIFTSELSVLADSDVGQVANVLLKLGAQKILQAETGISSITRPVAIIADEFQSICTRFDALFAQTCRGNKIALILLTQNLPNLFSTFGNAEGKEFAKSLLGNLNTWISGRNNEPETIKYISERIGSIRQKMGSRGVSLSSGGEGGNMGLNASQAEQFQPDLQPRMLTTLSTGGPRYGYVVEAIVCASPRRWSNGRRWLRASFPQRPLSFFARLRLNPARLSN